MYCQRLATVYAAGGSACNGGALNLCRWELVVIGDGVNSREGDERNRRGISLLRIVHWGELGDLHHGMRWVPRRLANID